MTLYSEVDLNEIAARWPGDDPDLRGWQEADVSGLIENGREAIRRVEELESEIKQLKETP